MYRCHVQANEVARKDILYKTLNDKRHKLHFKEFNKQKKTKLLKRLF